MIIQSCKEKLPDPKWFNTTNPVGQQEVSKNKIDIDIYVDATTSMEGFAVGDLTTYSQFLDQLEASANSAWKSADIKYFKFGERVREIERQEFLRAKNSIQFYRENGIFRKTYIDSVIKRTDGQRISVVLTDLFQDEGDVNAMVNTLKSRCFQQGIMIGMLGISTEFKGLVFDTPNFPKGYQLQSSERPFYALMFGDPTKIERLLESLKSLDYVKENQLLLISNSILNPESITLTKTRDSRFVNKKAGNDEMKDTFDFSMKKDGKEAKFNLEFVFDKNERCVDFNENTITPVVFKKSITYAKMFDPDSIVTNDIKIENIRRDGNKLTATLILQNNDPVGNYSYLVFLEPNQINGFITPSWITDFSTENPIPGTQSASLTYNLEKLVSRLIVAKNSVSSTHILKFYINIYKR